MSAVVRLTMLAALVQAVGFTVPARAVSVPTDFVVENYTPSATWDTPVGLAYLPGGRLLVIEKRGHVYSVTNGIKHPTPMLNITNKVLDAGDRGLLGIAVDPNYVANHYVYLLYTVDPDTNNNDNNDDAYARLVRYTVSFADSNVLDPASRVVLMGRTWAEGPVSCSQSHTIGTLRFGSDGSLLVGAGDGASFSYMDDGGNDPQAFQNGRTSNDEDIGAFRAQSLTSLCGKILRIDPATGQGYPSNPFWDGNASSIRSRVWAYGLRNPYRFSVQPGTGSTDPAAGNPGTVHIGDVGWNRQEELDIVTTPGMNFGWPCIEGPDARADYQAATPAHNGCDSYGTADNPRTPSAPVSWWHHSIVGQSNPPEFIGNTAIGGVYYTGTLYPPMYRNKYFAGDYGQSWIKVFHLDGSYGLDSVSAFGEETDGPVDFALEPQTRDIVYVAINAGEIRRIRYTGFVGNSPPVVQATAAPDLGVAPLQVAFSSAGTSDPDNDPFTISWDFGDGQGSSQANPAHTFTTPGTYDVVCSAVDADGIGRDTVRVIVAASSSFPSAGVLDDFNRANGPIGGSWVSATGLSINNNELTSNGTATSPVWNGAVFGADQEVYVTLKTIAPTAPEHDLLLKVQGTSYTAGHIEVRYTAATGEVQVSTYTQATNWVNRGAPLEVTFAAGDRFGARAYSNGTIEVFRNGVLIGTRSAGDWPFAASGGRLGMTLAGATTTRLDDFGGGNVVIDPNTPPSASITAPEPPFFFAEGDTIELAGTATDGQDASGALLYHWQVDLHHNTHLHPGTFVADGPATSFVGENHDDGTGVFYRALLIVTDTGGLKDTASVDLHPEIDLEPGGVTTAPSTPGTTAPATYRFAIANHGAMPSPFMRWRLRAGDTLLAEGDTLVPGGDSVVVTRTLDPVLAAGSYTLRVTVDTLETVFETSETNNASLRSLTVVTGPGPDEVPPSFTIGPSADPSVTDALVTWRTNEVSTGVLRWGTTPGLGDSLTDSDLENHHVATIVGLTVATRYFFQVVARDTAANVVTSAIDSFTTDPQPVAVGEPPLEFAFSSAHPNPSRGRVAWSLALPAAAHVEFAVLDVQGRRVFAAPARDYPAGRHTLEWDARAALHPGLYLARAVIDGRVHFRRFSVLR